MDGVLRKMLLGDVEEIVSIFKLANPNESKERITEYTQNVLKRFPQFCWVYSLKSNNHVIGGITASILKKNEKGYILDIAVKKKYQNQGYGKILLHKVLSLFNELNFSQISLGVHYLNARVIPFYYKFGFRLHEIRKSEFGPGQDAIIMHNYLT